MKKIFLLLFSLVLFGCSNVFFTDSANDNYYLLSPINEVECVPEKKRDFVLKSNVINGPQPGGQLNAGYSPWKSFCLNYNGVYGSNILSNSLSFGAYNFQVSSEKKSTNTSLHLGIAHAPSIIERDGKYKAVQASYFKYFIQNTYEIRMNNIHYFFGLSGNITDFQKFIIYSDNVLSFPTEFLTNDPFVTIEGNVKLRYTKSFYGLDLGLNLLLVQLNDEPRFNKSVITTGFYFKVGDFIKYRKTKK